MIKIKRIYEAADKKDGVRILVDRLWPRGVSKKDAQLDFWLKELGPSTELRKWFNHEANKFNQFAERYKEELKDGEQQKAYTQLREIIRSSASPITLLYAAREGKNNHVQVLRRLLS